MILIVRRSLGIMKPSCTRMVAKSKKNPNVGDAAHRRSVLVSKDECLKRLGDALRDHRRQLDISQEKLAHRAGLDRTYVGGAERGERNVSLFNLVKLAHALETDISDLLRTVDR